MDPLEATLRLLMWSQFTVLVLEEHFRSQGLIPHRPTYGNVLFTSTRWVKPGWS